MPAPFNQNRLTPPSSGGFDINDPLRSRVIIDQSMPPSLTDDDDDEQTGDPLDSDDAQQVHTRLLGYFGEESNRQMDNRIAMAIDEDFYDGIQWNADEEAALRERGQHALVLNVIAQTINWIIGTERRGRTDYKVLARRKDGQNAAQRKTELLKYLSDTSYLPFKRSRAFKDATVAGVGWLEDCLSSAAGEEDITTRYETWRNILWDSASTEYDLSDARYLFRQKWIDVDLATRLFPTRENLIEMACGGSGRIGTTFGFGDEVADQREELREGSMGVVASGEGARKRVRLIEGWFTRPQMMDHLDGSEFHGDIFDPQHPGHAAAIQDGTASVIQKLNLRVWLAVFVPEGLLYLSESPYRHNKFPFTPIWGYRYARNQLPYSIVRNLRGLQEDINKRFSKSLHILSTNKVLMEEGAVTDINDFMREASRPDAVLQVKAGKIGAVKLDVDRDLAPAHLDIMTKSISMVQTVGGVTDELMGRQTNAHSGVAITARQQQGMQATSELFDNLRLASQLQGEKQLSMVEQFFTAEKQFRITNSRGTPEYLAVNDGLPENDITRTKADFVIGDQDWRVTMRQAQAAELFDLLSKLPPQVALTILDLVVEHTDIPNADEIVKRIRALNGQQDPDNNDPNDPQEQARQQAAQQQAEMKQQMDELTLREKAAQVELLEAQGRRMQADAGRADAQTDNLRANTSLTETNTVLTAANAASVAMAPGVARVTDAILAETGFVQQDTAPQAQQQADSAMLQQTGGVAPAPMTPPSAQPAPSVPSQPAIPPAGAILPSDQAQPGQNA